MADITICFVCGAICTDSQKTDGTVWFCPVCGAPYGGAVQNVNTDNTEG